MKLEMLERNKIEYLLELARTAMERAYAPYSNFRVGACLAAEGEDGEESYYLGCNIENASYPVSNCAERTALFKAVFDGARDFTALAVISDGEGFTFPCGVCRQALSEFSAMDMPVICASRSGEYTVTTLGELLPMAFSCDALKGEGL